MVNCQMVEIYKEDIRDLLSSSEGLKIKESRSKGIYIQGVQTVPVVSEEELFEVF